MMHACIPCVVHVLLWIELCTGGQSGVLLGLLVKSFAGSRVMFGPQWGGVPSRKPNSSIQIFRSIKTVPTGSLKVQIYTITNMGAA